MSKFRFLNLGRLDDRAKAAYGLAERAMDKINSIQQESRSTNIFDIDLNRAYAPNADTFLDIPCYIGTSAVHPSVLYFPKGWNGYRYWMAFTPYENTDNQVENPSVVCSNDGQDWIVPPGVKNPLALSPGAPGYNSDTVLFMDRDGETMNLVYREYVPANKGSEERFYMFQSIDGTNWGTRKLIHVTDAKVVRGMSPAIVWTGTQYMMWYVDILMIPHKVVMKTSSDLVNWSLAVETDIVADVGRQIWHIDIKEYAGKYWALIQDDVADGAPGYLYAAKSDDGVHWTRSENPIMRGMPGTWQSGIYKSTFVPKITERGVTFDIWYTGTSSVDPYKNWWKIAYTTMAYRDLDRDALNQKVLFAINKITPYVMGDTFERPDASGLGTATSGQAWSASTGVFNVAGGFAVPSAAANTRSVCDVGAADCAVSADLYFEEGSQAWLIGRFVDGNNYLRAGIASTTGAAVIQRVQSGTATVISTGNKVKSGQNVEFRMSGDKLSLYVDGLLYCQAVTTFNQTATSIGIQADQTTTKFDNVVVKKNQ